MSAIVVSVISFITNGLGAGWAFVLLGGVGCAIVIPLTFLEMRRGVGWRRQRRQRDEKPEAKPIEADVRCDDQSGQSLNTEHRSASRDL
jgi:hypothetical protein